MAARDEVTADHGRLWACVNDLTRIQALPAIWNGAAPSLVVDTLLDVLLEALGAAFVFARLKQPLGSDPVDAMRIASERAADREQIGRALASRLDGTPPASLSPVPLRVGDQEISAVFYRLGLRGELGILVAGSERIDFPTLTERVLLTAATNQAAIGLHEAANPSVPERRALEPDPDVTSRTDELTKVEDALRKEIADRERSEKQVRQSEAYLAQAQRLSPTERKRIEDAFRLNDEPYRFLFHYIPIALWRMTSDATLALIDDLRRLGVADLGRYLDENPGVVYRAMEGTLITDVNQRTVELFGARDVQEMLGPVGRFWRNSVDDYKKLLEARFNGEEVYQVDTRLTTLDGNTIAGRYFYMAFPLALNAPGVSLGGFVDETDALRAQSRLAAIVSSSDDAIIGKTLEGIVTSWNTGAEQVFGYQAHEMIGRPIARIIPAELQAEETEILARLRQGERIKNYQTVRYAKDGRRIEISLTVSPVVDRFGRVMGASKVARDITAEKRAEAELQQMRDELARVARVTTLGELTAAIAHEVNQPLTGVINSGNACLRWLSHETPNLEAAQKSVKRMISEGNRAAEVIKRLRALIEKAPPRRDRINVNETIAEVLPLIHGELRRNAIWLRTDLAQDVPPVLGDRIQLQQVMLNLILNAIDAMSGTAPPRDLVVGTAQGRSNEVLVTVEDSGTGVDEKSLDRLFEAFYTTKPQGMGIGLAVSRTIVQSHGGSLWARPNEPRGAIFAFSLPGDIEPAS